jgi:hypothetical protein
MKTVIIIILAAVVALPIVSWAMYGYSWELSAWFGLLALLALAVIFINKAKGTKWF